MHQNVSKHPQKLYKHNMNKKYEKVMLPVSKKNDKFTESRDSLLDAEWVHRLELSGLFPRQ